MVRLHREDSGEGGNDGGGGGRGYGGGGLRSHTGDVSAADFKSDDSLPDSEGEDVGIVMRKSTRSHTSSSSSSSSTNAGHAEGGSGSGSGGLRLDNKQRRALFSLDRDDSFDSDEGRGDKFGERDDDDGDDDIELEGDLGQGEKERIVEAFERLGIDVRTPEGFDGEMGFEGEAEKREVGI